MSSEKLNRALTLPQLSLLGVGTMVGAGIYSVIGAAAGEAGTNLWISFVLAGIAAFLTVLSYAELASMFPKAGAEYQFLKRTFPHQPLFAFMAGYLIALNAAATSATVAVAFAGYLNIFIPAPILLTAFLLLLFCTIVNIAGIRESTWVSIGMIIIEVSGLLLIIWTGFWDGTPSRSFSQPPEWGNAAGLFAATALIFFIYIGFEDVVNLSEEVRNPTQTVPRALLISVGVTSLLYILVAVALIALDAPNDLARSDAPLSDAIGTVSAWRAQALAVAALFATASTALISLIAISRMLFGMAREGDMPRLLFRTWTARKTPWVAALVLFTAACLLLPLGEVKILASVSSFGVLLVFASVQLAVIALRFLQPDLKRPFRVPLEIGRLPVLPALGATISLAIITQFEGVVYLVGFGALAFGLAVYFLRRAAA